MTCKSPLFLPDADTDFQDITALLLTDPAPSRPSIPHKHALCSVRARVCLGAALLLLLLLLIIYSTYSQAEREEESLTDMILDLPE